MQTGAMSQIVEQRIPEWTLGWRLQRSLAHAGVSVQEMADELGVSRGTISRWCNDHNRPRRSDLRLWALRTGVPLDWLMGEFAPQHGFISVQTRIPAGIPGQPVATPGHAPVENEITRLRKRIPLNPALALVLRLAA
jgi:transcriptional regulator with XRE-family HTH domain